MLIDEGGGATEQALLIEFIRKQLAAALCGLRHALLGSQRRDDHGRQQRVVLLGIRGTGKSPVSERRVHQLKRPFIELNQEVMREAGQPLSKVFDLLRPDGLPHVGATLAPGCPDA